MNDKRRNNAARVLKLREIEHARRVAFHRNLFIMSLVLGLAVAAYPFASHASTITYDVNSPEPINYNEVNKFTASQDKEIKFAEVDVNQPSQLILSNKPIKQTLKSVAYTPKQLADLGWKINSTMTDTYGPVVKAKTHSLASRGLTRTPSLAQLNSIQPTAAPVTTIAAATPASTPVAAPQTTNTASQNISSSNLRLQSASMLPDGWTIGAGVTALLLAGLLINETRQPKRRTKTLTYKGDMGAAHEMIGKGKAFDFNEQAKEGEMVTVNTTYLNLLWHVGKFSKDGAINTYFYMAYFIPSQQAYAAALRRKSKVKPKEKA